MGAHANVSGNPAYIYLYFIYLLHTTKQSHDKQELIICLFSTEPNQHCLVYTGEPVFTGETGGCSTETETESDEIGYFFP